MTVAELKEVVEEANRLPGGRPGKASRAIKALSEEDRKAAKAAKKAAKEKRVSRAQQPDHLAKKSILLDSIEKGRLPREVVDAERMAALRDRMRREALGEVDTDGEEV
jgi:hypothetical protein